MGRNEDEYVTYTIVTCQESATSPADVATMKIKRFRGGSSKDWLTWSMQFRSLAKRKGWRADQLSVQLLTLIDGDLLREVERIASDASSKGLTFEDFYREVGLLLVPADYCEDLDEELWTLTKRREETVQRCTARLRQLAQMYADLPRIRKPSQSFNNVDIFAAPCRRTGRTSSRAAEFRMRR
ncbi:unnamed protein product [Hyaloperonospora brassicae]|uniref:Uncharacterized protein n=1 Tax=Hyaloperonospora brassicae TaxID=162125 RepID=A0AAV0U921_HYABA|nr:unnamed protein product [Hyaloperonospora brassicae]